MLSTLAAQEEGSELKAHSDLVSGLTRMELEKSTGLCTRMSPWLAGLPTWAQTSSASAGREVASSKCCGLSGVGVSSLLKVP